MMDRRRKWSAWATRLLYKDRWFLAIRRRPASMGSYYDTTNYRIVRPPRDRFYADPFLLAWKGRSYVFFEDYRYDQGKGLISCLILDENGAPLATTPVLERPYHLSFPFVFTWDGHVWMVPETSTNRTVELYRATRFPHGWVREAVLMQSLHASDTVILRYSDKWWLFTNIECGDTTCYDKLSLFSSHSLFGPWIAHPCNPIVVDAACARPAGAIFVDSGMLIRPGQDCSHRYGQAIQFNCISVLDDRRYQECPVWKTTPDWSAHCEGTHTYNRNDEFEVLDGYTRDFDVYGKWLSLRGWMDRTRFGSRLTASQ